MKKSTKVMSVVTIVLVAAISVMAVGYAALSANLTVTGTSSSGNATWNIDFKSINIVESESADYVENALPNVSGTAASFNVSLNSPGSKVVYELVVQNTGTIDATFNGITGVDTINETEPSYIKWYVERIDPVTGQPVNGEADINKVTGTQTFRVTIEWDKSISTKNTSVTQKNGTIYFDYSQKIA